MALVSTKEVAELLNIPSNRVTNLEKRDPTFPRALRLSHRTLRWDMDEVKAWIQQRKEVSNEDDRP